MIRKKQRNVWFIFGKAFNLRSAFSVATCAMIASLLSLCAYPAFSASKFFNFPIQWSPLGVALLSFFVGGWVFASPRWCSTQMNAALSVFAVLLGSAVVTLSSIAAACSLGFAGKISAYSAFDQLVICGRFVLAQSLCHGVAFILVALFCAESVARRAPNVRFFSMSTSRDEDVLQAME